jgi:hypothetical protein
MERRSTTIAKTVMIIAVMLIMGMVIAKVTLVGFNHSKTASKGPFIGESIAEICHVTTNAIAIHTSVRSPGPLSLVTLFCSFTKIMIKRVT